MSANTDAVRAFIEAFNSEDVDALVAVCDPEVEIQASRGIVIGHDEARRWATRNPNGDLHQRLVLDSLREDDHRRHVVAFVRREWLWREEGELAESDPLAIVASLGEDGLITRWQPFDQPDEALRAAGVGPG